MKDDANYNLGLNTVDIYFIFTENRIKLRPPEG